MLCLRQCVCHKFVGGVEQVLLLFSGDGLVQVTRKAQDLPGLGKHIIAAVNACEMSGHSFGFVCTSATTGANSC